MANKGYLLLTFFIIVLVLETVSAQTNSSTVNTTSVTPSATTSVSAQTNSSTVNSTSVTPSATTSVESSSSSVVNPAVSSSSSPTVSAQSSSIVNSTVNSTVTTSVQSSSSSVVVNAVSSSSTPTVQSSSSSVANTVSSSSTPTAAAEATNISPTTTASPTTAAPTTAAAPTTTAAPTTAAPTTAAPTTTVAPTTAATTTAATTTAAPTTDAPTTAATTTEKPTKKPATVKVEMEIKILEPYDEDFKNKSSDKSLAVKDKLTKAMQENLGDPNAEINIISITEGSIIVNFTVTVKVTPGVDPAKQLTEIIKSGKLGNFSVDKTYIVIVQNFPGVTLGDYKLNGTSYLAHCCKSTIGHFEMVRICTAASVEATCYGIKVKYEVDCGKAEGPPKCSKADTLTNMSVAIMILGYIFSKILPV